jgi:ATP-dependent RNA helicase DeaD
MKNTFESLGIAANWQQRLSEYQITTPTPIQQTAIPKLLNHEDLIAQAQTGTGKTLAFLLPILENMNSAEPHVQALVVTPTRELAIQITSEAKKLTEGTEFRLLAAYGGQDVEKQLHKLKGNMHLVIGTPGRLLDHLRRGTLNLRHLKMLVLDEADQMLHMGFLNEVAAIIHQTPSERQTMLFSATMPDAVRQLAKRYTKSAEQVSVKTDTVTLREISQLAVETSERGKQDALLKLLESQQPFMAIIFCRTKRRANALNTALLSKGFLTDELHGDVTQAKREKVMKSFRKAELQLLVATDVASRGLDIEGVTHIYNYDMVPDVDSYIHRIGRTGRAGQLGMAVTFVTPKDRGNLLMIEKGIRMTLERVRFEADHEFHEHRDHREHPGHQRTAPDARSRDKSKTPPKGPGSKSSGPKDLRAKTAKSTESRSKGFKTPDSRSTELRVKSSGSKNIGAERSVSKDFGSKESAGKPHKKYPGGPSTHSKKNRKRTGKVGGRSGGAR